MPTVSFGSLLLGTTRTELYSTRCVHDSKASGCTSALPEALLSVGRSGAAPPLTVPSSMRACGGRTTTHEAIEAMTITTKVAETRCAALPMLCPEGWLEGFAVFHGVARHALPLG